MFKATAFYYSTNTTMVVCLISTTGSYFPEEPLLLGDRTGDQRSLKRVIAVDLYPQSMCQNPEVLEQTDPPQLASSHYQYRRGNVVATASLENNGTDGILRSTSKHPSCGHKQHDQHGRHYHQYWTQHRELRTLADARTSRRAPPWWPLSRGGKRCRHGRVGPSSWIHADQIQLSSPTVLPQLCITIVAWYGVGGWFCTAPCFRSRVKCDNNALQENGNSKESSITNASNGNAAAQQGAFPRGSTP
jgi:hypothetical protein